MILAITRRELVGGGRAAKWYVLRAGYLVVLCLVTVPTLFAIADEIARTPGFRSFSRGMDYTLRFGLLELAMVALLSPAISITAVASEKASGVLELLHVAGVRPVQVVFGKLVARVSMLLLFIVSAVPLLVVGTVLGGAGAELVGLTVANCVGAAVLGTGLGLLVSGMVRKTIPALVLAYSASLVFYLAPFLLLLVVDQIGGRIDVVFEEVALALSPAVVLNAVARGSFQSTTPLHEVLKWVSAILPSVVGIFLTLLAVPFARPSLERSRMERVAETGLGILESPLHGRVSRTSRTVKGNPVAWREARSHRFGFGVRALRLLYLSLGGALAFHMLAFSVLGGVADLARAGVALLSIAAAGVTLIVASTSIATERESRALPLLSISRLSPAEIVGGKVEGLGLFLWPVAVLPIVPAIAFIGIDAVSFVVSVTMSFVLVFSAAGIGLCFSAFARRPATAVWASIAAAGAWLVLVPWSIGVWCRNRCLGEQSVMTLLNPVASVVSLANGFGRMSGERRFFGVPSIEPWVPYGGMILLLFVSSLAFAAATWRLSMSGGEA